MIPCFVSVSGVLGSSLYRYEVWQGSGEREVERGREREGDGGWEREGGRGRKREGSPDVLQSCLVNCSEEFPHPHPSQC